MAATRRKAAKSRGAKAKRAPPAPKPEESAAGAHVGEIPIAAVQRTPEAPAVRVVETDPKHAPTEVLHEEPEGGDEPPEAPAARSAPGEEAEEEEGAPLTERGAPAKDQLADVMAHLVFHKSLIREADAGTNVERYLALAREMKEGVHVVLDDPFDKCIALVFELVVSEQLNPWDIDLRKFSQIYLTRVKGIKEVDFIAAGKLMLMAWSVLKAQTDEVLSAIARLEAQRKADEAAAQGIGADPMELIDQAPWMGADDTTYNFTKAVLETNPFGLPEAVHPPGERAVTLYDLISAFEEAKEESATRVVLEEERAKARAELERARKAKVSGMMHNENLEEEIAQTWMKILEQVHQAESPSAKVPLATLHDGTRQDFLSAFISSLFLAFNARIVLEQDPFPTGEIQIQLTPEAQKGKLPAMPPPPTVGPPPAPAWKKGGKKGGAAPASAPAPGA